MPVALARVRCVHADNKFRAAISRRPAANPGSALRRSFAPQTGALTSLDRAMELGQVSARGADKIIRVAWSLADLAGKDQPGADQVDLAIGLWLGVTQ